MSDLPLATKHETRRRALKDDWGIDCSCSLCRSEQWQIQDSDAARRRIVELKETGEHAKGERYFQDAINITREWMEFAETEGVPDLEPGFHGNLAELYALQAAKTGLSEDGEKARRYARMAVDGWIRLGSVDEQALARASDFLRNLEKM